MYVSSYNTIGIENTFIKLMYDISPDIPILPYHDWINVGLISNEFFTEKGQKRHTFAKYASLRRRKPRLNFYEGNFCRSLRSFLFRTSF